MSFDTALGMCGGGGCGGVSGGKLATAELVWAAGDSLCAAALRLAGDAGGVDGDGWLDRYSLYLVKASDGDVASGKLAAKRVNGK